MALFSGVCKVLGINHSISLVGGVCNPDCPERIIGLFSFQLFIHFGWKVAIRRSLLQGNHVEI